MLVHLRDSDPAIAELLERERIRQLNGIELIASENFVSSAVLQAMGSVLTNKYAEGLPRARYYGGCNVVDEVEELARQRACQLFDAEHANVQPHSGAQANMAAYAAVLEPGDTVLGLSLATGGHLTHGSPVNFSGQLYRFVAYGLNRQTEQIDLDEIRTLARTHRPKLLVAGGSAYPRHWDFAALRSIADEVGALLMVDMAHFAGLVAAGVHPSPLPYAQIVTSTTHKTLRGPRGGLILCTADLAKAIDKAVFPGIQGGPLMHIIAAKAVCFGEALAPGFKEYQQRILDNAQALASHLQQRGWRLVSGGTDTHLMLLSFVDHEELTGRDAQHFLEQAGITTNKNAVPDDPRPPRITSGLRLGTPAITTRGMGVEECARIADWIDALLRTRGAEQTVAEIEAQVRSLCARFPLFAGEPR